MSTPAQSPVRTEDDLRAALKSLESQAPGTAAVLAAVERTRRRRFRGRCTAGIAAAAVAAATAVIVTVLLPGTAATPHSRPAAMLPPAVSVGRAMLTAFGTATGDVVSMTETGINQGTVVDIYQQWAWPLRPVPGERVRWRNVYSGRLSRSQPLKLTEDDGLVYKAPSAASQRVSGVLTVVCYTGTGQTGCGYADTETPPGAWSLHRGRFYNPYPGLADLSPRAVAREILKGQWRVTGRGRVDGQRAIELTENPPGRQRRGPVSEYLPLPTLLWVSVSTHLPLRMVNGVGRPVVSQFDWRYLPPTRASMALLRVPVPFGYRHIGS